MRCGCPSCGTWMVHSEGLNMGCVCPECGVRCRDCLGTNTLVSREALKNLKKDPAFQSIYLRAAEEDLEAEPDED